MKKKLILYCIWWLMQSLCCWYCSCILPLSMYSFRHFGCENCSISHILVQKSFYWRRRRQLVVSYDYLIWSWACCFQYPMACIKHLNVFKLHRESNFLGKFAHAPAAIQIELNKATHTQFLSAKWMALDVFYHVCALSSIYNILWMFNIQITMTTKVILECMYEQFFFLCVHTLIRIWCQLCTLHITVWISGWFNTLWFSVLNSLFLSSCVCALPTTYSQVRLKKTHFASVCFVRLLHLLSKFQVYTYTYMNNI